MNELQIHITEKDGGFFVNSKEVAEHFEKRHDHTLRDIEVFRDLPNFGEMFEEVTIPDSYGRPQRAYNMNRDGFSLLAMGFTGKTALSWKVRYIEAFNKMEEAWNSPEKVMARALLVANQTLEAKDKLIEEMKPKALFADAVVGSNTSILVRELAKLIRQNGHEIGEKRLWRWLRENGYILRNSDEPSQRAMEMELFERIERTVQRGNARPIVTGTTKVTGKGQQYFINKFLGAR